MPEFRSGKRKDGSRYSFPISGRQGGHSQPPMKTVKIEKVKSYGRFDQRDIDYAKDLIPECDEDKDFGWLPALERDAEREWDEQDRNRLSMLFRQIKNGNDMESAMALTELEKEYPTVFENFMGEKSDIPRDKERLTDRPVSEVFKHTAREAKKKIRM